MSQPARRAAQHERALQLGFLGGGVTSAVGYVHYAAERLDGCFAIAAGCFSRDCTANRQSAERYGVAGERVYADAASLLAAEAEALDAVVVLQPTPQHYAAVQAALSAGLPVICEKPLAATADEAANLAGRVTRERGFLAVTFNYCGYPMVRELRHRIAQGELGPLAHIDVEMPQEAFLARDEAGLPIRPQPWRLTDGPIPSMALDLGVHVHHLLVYLTGSTPAATAALGGCYGHFEGLTDTMAALVAGRDGVQATLRFNKTTPGWRNGLRLRVAGRDGAAEWCQTAPDYLTLGQPNGRCERLERGGTLPVAGQARYERFKGGHPTGFLEAFANVYADIHDGLAAYRGGAAVTAPAMLDAGTAADGLRLLQAISEAMRTRGWVAVPTGPGEEAQP